MGSFQSCGQSRVLVKEREVWGMNFLRCIPECKYGM